MFILSLALASTAPANGDALFDTGARAARIALNAMVDCVEAEVRKVIQQRETADAVARAGIERCDEKVEGFRSAMLLSVAASTRPGAREEVTRAVDDMLVTLHRGTAATVMSNRARLEREHPEIAWGWK